MGLGTGFEPVLLAAQRNGPWAFARLYDAYAGTVLGYVTGHGAADPDDSEDNSEDDSDSESNSDDDSEKSDD